MQSRLFSIFLTLTIAPPLIQQLQPVFIAQRSLFKSREGPSKIYSWWSFAITATLVEIPYRIVAGTLYWCCWYWPVFRFVFKATASSSPFTWTNTIHRTSPQQLTTFTAASVWLFLVLFEVFYTTFGQMIAALAPNELLASLLVPVFFTFVISFCGVVVPAMALPQFWHSWMYWLTPFHYLLEGLLGLVVHDVPVRCAEKELAIFSAPPGQTCDGYAGAYAMGSGGYVVTQANGEYSARSRVTYC
jgi:ATP-binding cassette subfamily G (WHITE) protein 2 (SNQ2)